jgi:hypothetical protein
MCALKESLDNTVLYGGMNWFGLCDTLQDGFEPGWMTLP